MSLQETVISRALGGRLKKLEEWWEMRVQVKVQAKMKVVLIENKSSSEALESVQEKEEYETALEDLESFEATDNGNDCGYIDYWQLTYG